MSQIISTKIIVSWQILRWGETVWKCRTAKITLFSHSWTSFLPPNPSRAEPDCTLAALDGAGAPSSPTAEELPASPPVDRMLEGTLIEALRAPIMLLVRADRLTGGSLPVVLCGKRLEEKPWYAGGVPIPAVSMVRALNYRLDNTSINVNQINLKSKKTY